MTTAAEGKPAFVGYEGHGVFTWTLLDALRNRGEQQVEGVEKVLGAAAWTYVAGAVSSVGSFLYVAYIVYSMVRRNE